jgi:hypothetical protein
LGRDATERRPPPDGALTRKPQETRSEGKYDIESSLALAIEEGKPVPNRVRPKRLRAELFTVEQLARHARALAANHQLVAQPSSNRLLARLDENEHPQSSTARPSPWTKSGASLRPPNGCSTTSI